MRGFAIVKMSRRGEIGAAMPSPGWHTYAIGQGVFRHVIE